MFIDFLTFVTDDPYYCGLRARVPNFVKSKTKEPVPSKRYSVSQQQPPLPLPLQHHLHHQHHAAMQHQHHLQQSPHSMWHARSYESGIGVYNSTRKFSKILNINQFQHLPMPRILHQPRK